MEDFCAGKVGCAGIYLYLTCARGVKTERACCWKGVGDGVLKEARCNVDSCRLRKIGARAATVAGVTELQLHHTRYGHGGKLELPIGVTSGQCGLCACYQVVLRGNCPTTFLVEKLRVNQSVAQLDRDDARISAPPLQRQYAQASRRAPGRTSSPITPPTRRGLCLDLGGRAPGRRWCRSLWTAL